MTINFIQPNYGRFPGGGFRIIYQYADALAGRGHEVRMIHPATLRRGIRQFPGYIRTWNQLKKGNDWYDFKNRVSMLYVKNLEEKNIPDADVTIASSAETSFYLDEYAASKGRKYYLIQDYEKWAGDEDYLEKSWKLPMHKLMISKHLLEMGEQMGISFSEMSLLTNPIDLEKFHPTVLLSERIYDIGMLYSEAERKGSLYGVEALKLLKEGNPELTAVLYGVFPRPQNLPEWISYYQNPDQSYLVESIYNQCKIFMCTSLYEGWGLPAMEAMACGAAVVTTDCGGVCNYAIPGETAVLVPLDLSILPKLLAENVQKLMDSELLQNRLRQNGVQKVKEFSLENATDVLEALLRG